MDESVPKIASIHWIAARTVLGGEASNFTPWLADNLDILAEAIGLAELNLVETESSVGEKRLDILATGIDEDGQARPVAIENQYGISNHGHLGQLVTYLAQQGKGLAVWVVEDFSEAHLAAVEFLNRTSTGDVGYILARVRFTPSTDNAYEVYFEVAARPNEFVRRGRRRSSDADASGKINIEKRDYLAEILERLAQRLSQAGFKTVRMHRRGAYIHMGLPQSLDLAPYARMTIRATQARVSVRLHLRGFDTREENSAALDLLRERYEKPLLSSLPGPAGVDWHGGTSGADSDFAGIDLDGQGYRGGDAVAAADWAAKVCSTWLEVLKADPMEDVKSLVEAEVVSQEEPPLELDEGDGAD